jgi:hypothetical protein
MSHRALVRTVRSIGEQGLPSGSEEQLRQQILHNVDRLTETQRIAGELRRHTESRGDRILVETMLNAVLLTPEMAVEEEHLFELVQGFEQSVIDEALETGALGYSGGGSRLADGQATTEWKNDRARRDNRYRLPSSIASKAGLSRHGERLLEATLFRFPKPGNVLHTLAEFLEASRALQASGILFLCNRPPSGNAALVLPDEVAAAVKIVLGFELKPEKQRLLQDHLGADQLGRALQRQGLSAFGPKSDLSDRLVKSEVRPSEVLNVLSNEELTALCEALPMTVVGTFKQDRIREIIMFFDNLVVEDHGVRGINRPAFGPLDQSSLGCGG